jgi:hypothetical protein
MTETFRYAIQVVFPQVPNAPRYVSRQVGMHMEGELSTYVEDAKTWGTIAGARGWINDRPDWKAYRAKEGHGVNIVRVRMGTRVKSAPTSLAPEA